MTMKLDHLAVAGETLDEAVERIETALGIGLRPGGHHDVFATHNRLLGLADGLYLEAIAIDPMAPAPGRSRWFDLDRFRGPARLSNWICATGDLDAALTTLPGGAGQPVALGRGDLKWRMAVPQNGVLPYDNMFPALIEWQSPMHPSAVLPDSGCRLRRLVVTHPDATDLAAALAPVFDDQRVAFEAGAPGLRAEIETPKGLRVLQ